MKKRQSIKGIFFYEDRFRMGRLASLKTYFNALRDGVYKKKAYKDRSEDAIEDNSMFMGGIPIDKLAMLDAAWEKEIGIMGRFCELLGIRAGKTGPCLVVKPKSSAAASEISLRSSEIIRNINKYFNEPWIKALKLDSEI